MTSRSRRLRPLLLAALVVSCSGDNPDEPPGPPGPVATVEVTPDAGTLPEGLTLKLQAIARDSAGRLITGRRVAWSSTNVSAATVDTSGTVIGIETGSATIVAVVGGKNASADITVTDNPVTAVEVTPAEDSLKDAKTLQLTATPKDAQGRSLQGKTVVWSAAGTARVDEDGLVSTNGLGLATITATVDGVTGSAEITTYRLPVAAIVPSTRSRVLIVGDSLQFSWSLLDQDGDFVFIDDTPVWSSSNTAVAQVLIDDSRYNLRVIGTGTTTLRGTLNAVTVAEEMTVIPPTAVTSVSTGDGLPCAVTADNVGLCWEITFRPTFDGGKAFLWPRGPQLAPAFNAIEAADSFACGLTTAGVAQCWGQRGYALGRGTADTSSIPAPAAGGLTFTALSASAAHTCALTAAGAAYCWGLNSTSQLGAASTGRCDGDPCSLEPIALDGGLTFRSISAGAWHTCALTSAGKAYCWGDNGGGELGDGTTDDRATPTPVAGNLTFATISAGGTLDDVSGRTCGVTTGGLAYCWGFNVGDGTTTVHSEPTPVAGEFQWREVAAGPTASCGIVTSGDAYCWGEHRSGQLGTGNTAPSLVPALVAGGHTWSAVDAGSSDQNCGLTTAGIIYCWGRLLDGKTFTPVELLGQP